MKTEFKAKFLQHVAKRKREGGFTLIELLVVIIIIGILSAIALPSFLNQANKAKQSEAKQYLSSINKGQQAVYAENSDFASEIVNLGLGIKTATNNYTYSIDPDAQYDGKNAATATTQNAASGLHYYSSGVYLVDAGEADTTQTIICQSEDTSTDATADGPAFGLDANVADNCDTYGDPL